LLDLIGTEQPALARADTPLTVDRDRERQDGALATPVGEDVAWRSIIGEGAAQG
jgi:hypothetical protein